MYSEDLDQAHTSERMSEDVYSKPVRAGKRTYFFDVKSTRGNDDYYITITESKRRQEKDGTFTYDKHKIFLYKEDFDKFGDGLTDVISYIRTKCFDNTPAPSEDAMTQDTSISSENHEQADSQSVPINEEPSQAPASQTEDQDGNSPFTDVKFEEL
ncbi:MAG: DUF3276 family protein [Bacteroidales bacterium]